MDLMSKAKPFLDKASDLASKGKEAVEGRLHGPFVKGLVGASFYIANNSDISFDEVETKLRDFFDASTDYGVVKETELTKLFEGIKKVYTSIDPRVGDQTAIAYVTSLSKSGDKTKQKNAIRIANSIVQSSAGDEEKTKDAYEQLLAI